MAPILSFTRPGKTYASASGSTIYNRGTSPSYHAPSGYQPEGLQDLTTLLGEYDRARATLEEEGGDLFLAEYISHLLSTKIKISGPYGDAGVSLSQPDRLRSALLSVGQSDVKFNVRRLEHGLPAYYIARIHRDWWGIYSLIVEDIHLGPGYPLFDPRFARIMTCGKERYYLRLSLFREPVTELFPHAGEQMTECKDTLLYDLGRCIFQGAWHTDQRFAFVFADMFGLPALRNAIELAYLCLSCDLCSLRRFLTPEMHAFFEACHPNRGINSLLGRLDEMTGAQMSDIKQRGLEAYRQLAETMNRFLDEEVRWSSGWRDTLPLRKIVVANVNRLEIVATQLKEDATLCAFMKELDNKAARCIESMLEENHEIQQAIPPVS